MKIGIIADTHFGHQRFEEDAFKQGREGLLRLAEKADIVLHAGDFFDVKVPSFNILYEVISILNEFSKQNKPLIVVRGNHERRSKDLVDSLKLLSSAGLCIYKNWDVLSFEKNDEKVNILVVGNVPDEDARGVINMAYQQNKHLLKDGFNILLIHQEINEYSSRFNEKYVSVGFLKGLGFDLVVNGHIHRRYISHDFIIPGSTVVTKLNEEELTQPRGVVLYDTKTKKAEEIILNQRKGVYVSKHFSNATIKEVNDFIVNEYSKSKREYGNIIMKIKLTGTLKQGLLPSDVLVPDIPYLFIDNQLNKSSIDLKINEIRKLRINKLSVKEFIENKLNDELSNKMKILKPIQLYDELLEKEVEDILEDLL